MAKIIGKNIGDTPGTMKDYAGGVVQQGYVLCDGAIYDSAISTYSVLFSKIGHTWDTFNGQVSPGGTLFRVPKINGLLTVGSGAAQVGTVNTSLRTLGTVFGAETHTLTIAQLAQHDHSNSTLSATASASSDHNHLVFLGDPATSGGSFAPYEPTIGPNDNNNYGPAGGLTSTSGAHSHIITGSVAMNGSGTAHNNIQPSAVVTKIIKY